MSKKSIIIICAVGTILTACGTDEPATTSNTTGTETVVATESSTETTEAESVTTTETTTDESVNTTESSSINNIVADDGGDGEESLGELSNTERQNSEPESEKSKFDVNYSDYKVSTGSLDEAGAEKAIKELMDAVEVQDIGKIMSHVFDTSILEKARSGNENYVSFDSLTTKFELDNYIMTDYPVPSLEVVKAQCTPCELTEDIMTKYDMMYDYAYLCATKGELVDKAFTNEQLIKECGFDKNMIEATVDVKILVNEDGESAEVVNQLHYYVVNIPDDGYKCICTGRSDIE